MSPNDQETEQASRDSSALVSQDGEYTEDGLSELEQANEKYVTNAHLYYALDHMIELLHESGIPYAIMGGVHMQIRGFAERTTRDVDIAVAAGARTLYDVLINDPRHGIPP
jgi:hypothetical protein